MSNLGTNPNKEVRIGLMKSLLPNYLRQYTADGLSTIPNVTIRITRGITNRCFTPSSAC